MFNVHSGSTGEQSLNYFYRYLPKKEITIIQDKRILHMDYYFQIDTLILTPCFALLLEIKNYGGHLYFDDKYGQLIRTLNQKKDIFEDPLLQVKRQAFHLKEVLKQNKLAIPIEPLVVISNLKAFVECSPTYKEAQYKVIKSPQLQHKYEQLNRKYNKEVLSINEKRKIHRVLKKLHEPYNPDILIKYGIDKSELITGVLCPVCNHLMERITASWQCMECSLQTKTAHTMALRDYALLISTTITNKECKEFLHLSSSMQSYYLLKSLNLPFTGSTRSRTYQLDSLIT